MRHRRTIAGLILLVALAMAGSDGPPPSLTIALYPALLVKQELRVEADVRAGRFPPEELRLVVDLERQPDQEKVASALPQPLSRDGKVVVSLSLRELAPGDHVVVARLENARNGQVVAATSAPLSVPPRPTWLGSKEGITDEVLPGFAPLESEGTTIRPWGRRYVFGERPLPDIIESQGLSVLAEPPRMRIAMRDHEFVVASGRWEVLERRPQRVRMRYAANVSTARVEEDVVVEYDGMARIDLRIVPSGAIELRRLVVELPFDAKCAKYFYRFPGQWGSVANAGAVPDGGMALPFYPYVSLSDEDRSLAWFTESSQGWNPADPSRAIEIERTGGTTVLRLNMISKPTDINEPLAFTFGMQATPVRPPGPDAWDMRIVRDADYDIDRLPPRVLASIAYPGAGNVDLERGSVEFWASTTFDSEEAVPAGVDRTRFNRDLFSVRWPDGDRIALYWDVDDRGLRFAIREDGKYPLVIASTQSWPRGVLRHVALTWGEAIRIYVDGDLVAERPWHGTLARDVAGSVLGFGGEAAGFVVDEVRVSSDVRSSFDREHAPVADDTTLLLDHLDGPEYVDGRECSRAERIRGSKGGELRGVAAFAEGRFGSAIRLYPEGAPRTHLDYLASLGVRALVFHEHWTDIQNYPASPRPDDLKRLVRNCHAAGMMLLLYFGYELSDRAPGFQSYATECLAMPLGQGYRREPTQRCYRVCYRSAWSDFLVDAVAKTMNEFDVDGVYLDNTAHPWQCINALHGCGVADRTGDTVPTYPIWAVRNVMQRIRASVASRRPQGLVNVHSSLLLVAPTMDWASSAYDGEQLDEIPRRGPLAEILPLDTFRAEFSGRVTGVPAELLCYPGRPFTYSEALSMALLHDVPVRGKPEDLGLLWRAMDRIPRREAQFIPYWASAPYVRVEPSSMKMSLWCRSGRSVLMALSNISDQRQEADVSLDVSALGFRGRVELSDAVTGESWQGSSGHLRVGVAAMGWRLLWLRPGAK